MRNVRTYTRDTEPCLVKSVDIAMYHVSPRLWLVICDGIVHKFTNRKEAETLYRSLV